MGDLRARQRCGEALAAYHPFWLRLGMEVVVGAAVSPPAGAASPGRAAARLQPRAAGRLRAGALPERSGPGAAALREPRHRRAAPPAVLGACREPVQACLTAASSPASGGPCVRTGACPQP